ncbi:hypothetical protein N657DRAFT_645893 [Parathielavia appendiculata]|uniref:NADH dehydrogenase [ubiquinone] 1 alpha subcomplex subunit n=1 Tax=Parathielavia appendiculata TaxID=2587402 RepID=A0AAN6Z322_9PEZI|nr:hypothetical protein N657DRAFT_645893 [Parathielavia appendiculata]
MSQPPISPFLRAWYKWKMLRLPWRRQFLIGLDLNGNTYWEFLDRGSRLPSPDPLHHPLKSPVRWRRIVRYPRGAPYSSSVPIPPAWHQWLRHARADPPSLAEQQAEVARQERIRVLAAQADARWEAKPKVMEGPMASETRKKMLGVREPALETERQVGPGSKVVAEARAREDSEVKGDTVGAGTGEERAGDSEVVDQREQTWERLRRKEEEAAVGAKEKDPWKQARGGSRETWQPQAWAPAAREKK